MTDTETLHTEGSSRSHDPDPEPGLVLLWSPQGPACTPIALRKTVEIGRAGVGGIKLGDRKMSRRHCAVTCQQLPDRLRWDLVDHDSRNGTHVDGRRLIGSDRCDAFSTLRAGASLFVPVADLAMYTDGVERVGRFVVGPRMRTVRRAIAATAHMMDRLLLTGETGAGKEHIARVFHDKSPRAGGPFVAVNCATIPEGLAERELFGSLAGGYTHAKRTRGSVLAADRGTLFLDEIGELDPNVQSKLLRFLQNGEIKPVGGDEPRRVDVRVVVATHRDLASQVAAGRFREDLYYRLALSQVRIPPLRERVAEIPWLVCAALEALPADLRAHVSLVETCLLRPWPGNVRELLGSIQGAAQTTVADGRTLVEAHDLDPRAGMPLGTDTPKAERPNEPEPRPRAARRKAPSREELVSTLCRERGNVSRTARALGVHRNSLYRWMSTHGIRPEDYGEGS